MEFWIKMAFVSVSILVVDAIAIRLIPDVPDWLDLFERVIAIVAIVAGFVAIAGLGYLLFTA